MGSSGLLSYLLSSCRLLYKYLYLVKTMNVLRNGQRLLNGQNLFSSNRSYKLCVQTDGNLVVYKSNYPTGQDIPIWSSQTWQKGVGPYSLVMQNDNHLCLYGGNGQCTWANDVYGYGHGNCFARMQDDGNFVVYDQNYQALWCTRTDGGNVAEDKYHGVGDRLGSNEITCQNEMRRTTPAPNNRSRNGNKNELFNGERLRGGEQLISRNGCYKLCVQTDGNLVVYKLDFYAAGASSLLNTGNDIPVWSSQTWQKGPGPHELVMQSDNHLCMYDANGQCTWANGVHRKGVGKVFARMQDDGNLVVYDEAETALWCTRTDGGNVAEDKYQGKGHDLTAMSSSTVPNRMHQRSNTGHNRNDGGEDCSIM